jgi:hypothetical protein
VETDEPEKDWKLKLRYGKLKTPYKHYTAIAEGVVREGMEDFSCPPGNAFMGMKTWASSPDESADMIRVIGERIGFAVTGRIQIYETEPAEPPRENPYGYDINFTPFRSDDAT